MLYDRMVISIATVLELVGMPMRKLLALSYDLCVTVDHFALWYSTNACACSMSNPRLFVLPVRAGS